MQYASPYALVARLLTPLANDNDGHGIGADDVLGGGASGFDALGCGGATASGEQEQGQESAHWGQG